LRRVGCRGAVVIARAEATGLTRVTDAIKVTVNLRLRAAVGINEGGWGGGGTLVASIPNPVSVRISLARIGDVLAVVNTGASGGSGRWRSGVADEVAVCVHLDVRAAATVDGRGGSGAWTEVAGVACSIVV
jgi:hypothetical protein